MVVVWGSWGSPDYIINNKAMTQLLNAGTAVLNHWVTVLCKVGSHARTTAESVSDRMH